MQMKMKMILGMILIKPHLNLAGGTKGRKGTSAKLPTTTQASMKTTSMKSFTPLKSPRKTPS